VAQPLGISPSSSPAKKPSPYNSSPVPPYRSKPGPAHKADDDKAGELSLLGSVVPFVTAAEGAVRKPLFTGEQDGVV